MTRADRRLRILLRFVGGLTLLALPAVFMPKSWMASTHELLGLGEFPDAPIVQNLARSVSGFYALFGGVCLVLATDLDRYRALIRFLGIAVTVFGVILIGVDVAAGMPVWWTLSEGLSTIVIGVLMVVFARPEH
jgi:hypothetical protein